VLSCASLWDATVASDEWLPLRYWFRSERKSPKVIKLDQLSALFNLGRALAEMESAMNQRLTGRGGEKVLPRLIDVSAQCFKARFALQGLLGDAIIPLKDSKKSAAKLVESISAMITGPNIAAHAQETLNPYFSDPLRSALADFYGDLALELGNVPVYFTTAKRGYDRDILLNEGEKLLDESDLSYLSSLALQDIRKSTACVMFDFFTASGFHSARAVEGVARNYYVLVKGQWATEDGSEGGRDLNLSKLADTLRIALKPYPDAERARLVANTLDRMRVIYRNPIIHPDVILSEPDAARLIGLMVDAISEMVADIREGGAHFSALWGIRF
jgi:hypothetical protein